MHDIKMVNTVPKDPDGHAIVHTCFQLSKKTDAIFTQQEILVI